MQVSVTDEALTVELSDGRSVSAPLAWYPRLLHGSVEERQRWRLIGQGRGIHWPDLDEDISVENLLAGRPSAESQRSLKKRLSRARVPRAFPGPLPARRIQARVDRGRMYLTSICSIYSLVFFRVCFFALLSIFAVTK